MTEFGRSEVSRREAAKVVGAAGAVIAGTGALAGCGQVSQTASSAVSAAASNAASAVKDAVSKADVPVGGGVVLKPLKVIVTQPTAGDYKAFSAVCPHQGCLVGGVTDGLIVCPCHNSQFDIATGEVKAGPAKGPLAPKQVTLGADGLTIT